MGRQKSPKDLKTKKQLCLDCQKRKVLLVFKPQSGCFEGKRICKTCSQAQKRRFLNAYNGD